MNRRMGATLLTFGAAIALACSGQGDTPEPTATVTIAWAVRGPAGETVLIETSPGYARKVKLTENGAAGSVKVTAGKEAKLWADLPGGQVLTCVLTSRSGESVTDQGAGHCQTKLKTRLTPDK